MTMDKRPMNPVGPDIMQEIAHLPLEELEALKIQTLTDIGQIDASISQAQGERIRTGVYAESDWWRRVHSARKIKGITIQAIQTRISQLKREHRERQRISFDAVIRERQELRQAFEHQFLLMAKVLLDEATFTDIADVARERASKEGRPNEIHS